MRVLARREAESDDESVDATKGVNMVLALGLMSGTSLDGIDAALLRSDGEAVERIGAGLTLPYDDATRNLIRECLNGHGDREATADRITRFHAIAVEQLVAANKPPVDLIGFHGQTVYHSPENGLTLQIGNAALLAELTGVDVVSDFRSRDMAAGGEGAPLAPLYHAALVRDLDTETVAVLNIGGVANVTWCSGKSVIAFDTGPGGALLDDWLLEKTGEPFDRDGALARSGRVHDGLISTVLDDHPYFSGKPPKSLDRNAFSPDLRNLTPADGAATLTALTVETIALATKHLPHLPDCWIVCGGGRHNQFMMSLLARRLDVPVKRAEEVGWNGDMMEAEAFAYLAVRSLQKMPLSLPSTTGCSRPVTGGALYRA